MSGSAGTTRVALAVAALTFVVGVLAIDARATYGARVTADEPQYLTTALSLAEDFDLDISDELDERAFEPYHEISLNPQTIDLNDSGQRISPHDPLLPLLLAAPMGLGGWQAAKATLALIAALTAAGTVVTAVTRFRVSPSTAGLVVGGFFVSPPLVAYATQVYPEMPAATCVVAGLWALTAPRLGRVEQWTALVAIVALPWLAVKYVPVAAVITIGLLARGGVPTRWRHGVLLAAAGLVYLVAHQRIYGGWTVYASGDHFVDGEFLVVGRNPDYVGRTRRLVGLVIDRNFGLAAWTPAYVAAVPALAWFVAARRHAWLLVGAVVAAGWATATWVALTMHGWWWPGRQLVVILPAVVIVVAVVADRAGRVLAGVIAGCAIGSVTWLWLVIEASTGRRTLVVDFDQTANPWYRSWRQVLPDHQRMNGVDVTLTVVWTVALATAAVLAWRRGRAATDDDSPTEPGPVPVDATSRG